MCFGNRLAALPLPLRSRQVGIEKLPYPNQVAFRSSQERRQTDPTKVARVRCRSRRAIEVRSTLLLVDGIRSKGSSPLTILLTYL